MSFFLDFWYYLAGSFIFALISILIVKLLNKVVVHATVDAVLDTIDDVSKYSRAKKPKNDDGDKKLRDIEQEFDEQAIQEELELENQSLDPNLEILGNGEKLKKVQKKSEKIVGLAEKEKIVKGKFSKNIVEETLESLKGVNMKTMEKGINQAKFEAQNKRGRSSHISHSR